ncbi:MAG TPA: response regulator transcription factor [Coleofasciculaceae cyanobacterium]
MEIINLSSNLKFQSCSSASVESALVYAPDQGNLIQRNRCISIISNSHLLHEALVLPLKAHQSIQIVSHYAGDVDIVPTIINPPSHLVLLDSGIGHNLTITQIQQWRSLQPSPYVVVLELKNDIDLILNCVEAGTHAYVLQGASSAEITQVIEQVYQGIFQCSPEVTAQLFERLSNSKSFQKSDEKPPLTRRELEVLHYVAKEYSDRQIATQLTIEVRTVKHHVHNILHKLNVKHRWDAAQLALKKSWLDLTSS